MVQNRAMHRRYFFNTDFNTNVEELHELFDLKAAPYLSYINSIKILFNEKIERWRGYALISRKNHMCK